MHRLQHQGLVVAEHTTLSTNLRTHRLSLHPVRHTSVQTTCKWFDQSITGRLGSELQAQNPLHALTPMASSGTMACIKQTVVTQHSQPALLRPCFDCCLSQSCRFVTILQLQQTLRTTWTECAMHNVQQYHWKAPVTVTSSGSSWPHAHCPR